MLKSIPFVPFSVKTTEALAKGFYPVTPTIRKMFPFIERELEASESVYTPQKYAGAAAFAFTAYSISFILAILLVIATGIAPEPDNQSRVKLLINAFLMSSFLFLYIMIYPKWIAGKRKVEMEKDLLFAIRHMMIQTSAGIPLFEAIVSLTESYEESGTKDEQKEYGEVGKELSRVVLEVRSGKELTASLEECAERSSSHNFRKAMWQLANANKTGSRIGPILKDEVEYLANEQLIMIRSYGSQLGTLALFYMIACIIAPTMGVVMLAIGSSVLPTLPFNETTYALILILLIIAQVMFVGIIKSRRPAVSL